MRAKLTNRVVNALKSRVTAYEVWDEEIPGLVLRVLPSGICSYSLRYRTQGGKRNRITLGPTSILTVAQAKDLARDLLADVRRGDDPAEKRKAARAASLGQFLKETYGPWVTKNRKSGALSLASLVRACGPLLDKKLSEITGWAVEKWRTERYVKEGHVPSGNRHMSYLRAAMAKAAEWGLLPENPLSKVRKLKEDTTPKMRFLTDEESARLFATLDAREERMRAERDNHNAWCRARGYAEWPDLRAVAFTDYLKPMVLLSLHTGLRRGEVFSLDWQDVDPEAAILTVRGGVAKSGKTRHIPLNAVALDALTKWRAQNSGQGLVFPNPETGQRFDNVHTAWKNLLKETGIEGFRWHDMRHTFASRLAGSGVDLYVVKELLGHQSITQTERYSHLTPRVKAEAVARLVPHGNVVAFRKAAEQA